MKTTLLDLWHSSALIQGLMALGSLGAIIYLSVRAMPIPDVLIGVVMAIIGYYFGSKSSQQPP